MLEEYAILMHTQLNPFSRKNKSYYNFNLKLKKKQIQRSC